MTQTENQKRAARVVAALDGYKAYRGDERDTPETDVIDLMTDIRHFCDVMKLDIVQIARMSNQHYIAELAGE